MLRANRVPPLRDKDRQVLHHQTIDDQGPGTVLPGFETLLRHIGPDGVPVSGKYDLLPQKSLPQLNGQLARSIKIGLKRPQLKSFPQIQGMYLLLRAENLSPQTVTAYLRSVASFADLLALVLTATVFELPSFRARNSGKRCWITPGVKSIAFIINRYIWPWRRTGKSVWLKSQMIRV